MREQKFICFSVDETTCNLDVRNRILASDWTKFFRRIFRRGHFDTVRVKVSHSFSFFCHVKNVTFTDP